MARNILPEAFLSQQELLTKIAAQHTADGTKSVLAPFLTQQNIDIAKAVLAGKEAAAHEQSRLLLTGTSETQRRLRDNMFAPAFETALRDKLWLPVFKNVKEIGSYLLSLYSSNPKKVTAWGFDIVDSTTKQQLRTTILKPAEQITSATIVIGSTFTNIGTVPLHVYKGKVTTGTPVVIAPNEKFGILKGYSSITVINPSTLESGKFTTLVNR